MKTITARDNPFFKRLKQLAGTVRRDRRAGQALAEGLHLATTYLDTLGQPRACMIAASALSAHPLQPIMARIDPARIVVLADTLFAQLSTLARAAQCGNVIFLIDIPAPELPLHLTQDCLILDGVQDAGNVGSILRSAAAAGVRYIFCAPGTAYAWSPKVLRAGMGAHFFLHIFTEIEIEKLMPHFAIPLIVTDSHSPASIYEQDLTKPCAWIWGNEGAGVSAVWREHARYCVTIPQVGEIESINVAAAAAVCLFEQRRQRNA
ncbi:RNA methyltransferase [Mycoavidus sp. B2-EB]|uniref:TrmH family RNA methyltransferase n=1 Tax=Mycoavidus sp. B2-EB TaxID=2651972 RepID=UPI001629F2EF|nr:RNA methyltransferase [Mycoavidus sp. B2-EB]BBO59571.1 RNA methyltransferase [Mycoavidus sp. B2-EB]